MCGATGNERSNQVGPALSLAVGIAVQLCERAAHEAICSDDRGETLNLVAAEHGPIRDASVELTSGPLLRVVDVVAWHVDAGSSRPMLPFPGVVTGNACEVGSCDVPRFDLPTRHAVLLADVDPKRLQSVLLATYERAPRDFETLLGIEGVGARTLRALALVSEVIDGTPASTRDPARFAFAHGGKHGTPFPVDRATYPAFFS